MGGVPDNRDGKRGAAHKKGRMMRCCLCADLLWEANRIEHLKERHGLVLRPAAGVLAAVFEVPATVAPEDDD